VGEQRKYARIESSIVCSVASATEAFEAVVANLSKSGAAIIGPDGVGVGESLTVMLERAQGLVTVSLPCTVVRKEERGERVLYGVEFEQLPPDDEERLVSLLQSLAAGRGQGRRTHPRVGVRVEVVCRTETIFRTKVHDLSRGGLSLKSGKPLPPGSAISVSYGMANIQGLVEVSGEVVSSQPAEGGGFRVGVRFDPLSAEEQAQVNYTLDVLLGIGLAEAQVVEEDE
jgi:c-di-GMP-binding flagellar brake protein YcgR